MMMEEAVRAMLGSRSQSYLGIYQSYGLVVFGRNSEFAQLQVLLC